MVPEPKQSGFRTRSAHHDLTSLAVRVPRRAPALPWHIVAAPIHPRRGRKGPEAFRKHECEHGRFLTKSATRVCEKSEKTRDTGQMYLVASREGFFVTRGRGSVHDAVPCGSGLRRGLVEM